MIYHFWLINKLRNFILPKVLLYNLRQHTLVNTWQRHQMKTFFALLVLCEGNSLVICEFPSQRAVTQSFDVSLICAWTNGWVNNRNAGDLRRHRAHYDVIIIGIIFSEKLNATVSTFSVKVKFLAWITSIKEIIKSLELLLHHLSILLFFKSTLLLK